MKTEEKAEKKGLEPNDYEMAIFSQEACNLSGIVFAFARVMEKICEEAHRGGHGTDWKNNHPIARLYAEQIRHLTQGRDWSEAYRICQEKAKEVLA
jgi:hypothetical protein